MNEVRAAVLDTSVIFKWYHHAGEEDVEAALLLRDAYLAGELHVIVTDLLIYEITNALRYSGLAPERIADAVRTFWALGLDVHPVDAELSESMARIAGEFDISVYDAAFLALARRLPAALVTADRALRAKAGSAQTVILLSELMQERCSAEQIDEDDSTRGS